MLMPRTMKAAILVEQNQALVIDQVTLPERLDVGQVLVKVHYSGICGSQLGEIDGVKGPDKYLPHLLGHEASGTVIEIGPGVKHVKPEDKVVLHWRKGLGIESSPPLYQWQGKQLNAGCVTTFNEYAIVSENRLTTIPNDADMQIAALFGCAVTTGFGVVVNDAKLSIGESVIIFGAGGIGLNIVQAAAMVSAYPIIAVDLFDNRLELAKTLGATHTINAKKSEPSSLIKEMNGGVGLDCFIDNTGNPEIIKMGYTLTRKQGRTILVGVPNIGDEVSLYTLPLHFGKQILGSHGGESIPYEDIPRYINLYRRKRLKLNELITEEYFLDDINMGLHAIRSGKAVGRCVISL